MEEVKKERVVYTRKNLHLLIVLAVLNLILKVQNLRPQTREQMERGLEISNLKVATLEALLAKWD